MAARDETSPFVGVEEGGTLAERGVALDVRDAGGPASPTGDAASGPKVRRTRREDRWTILRPHGSVRPGATFATTRTLLFATAAREVRSRYKQNIGRGIWMIVSPAAMVAIYGFVFTQIFQATGEGLPYLSMVWAGIILWQFFQHGVQIGMMSIGNESGTLPKIWFPRVVIPLAPGASAFVDLGIGMVLLFATALIQGVRPDLHALLAVLPIAVLAVWMFAAALFLAPLAVYLRDLSTIVPLLLRLGFFASPVMYSTKAIPDDLAWLADWNPVAACIDGVRDTILAGSFPDWTEMALHGSVGAVLLAAAFWYFQKVQDRLVDAL